MTGHRIGDAGVTINGERKILRLTLGALASLEETLGQGEFSGLERRLASPRVADILLILQALLQGGGFLVSIETLKASDIDLADAARAIAKAFASLAATGGPHPGEARGVVSKDEGGRRILRDASLREAPQDEGSR